MSLDRIWDFLQRLTPVARSCLLNELERLELSGVEIPGSSDIQAKLRVEFRKDGSTHDRANSPTRYFFAPLEPLLIDGAPDQVNSGRIQRSSLAPIWEWICRDLLPTMARDFNAQMKDLIAADKQREAGQAAAVFQIKVAKSLENIVGSPEGAEQIRVKLSTYTAARTAFGDVTKIMCALRARDALAKFDAALPERILKLDDGQVVKMTGLLDSFAKKQTDAVPFALALVARRLKTSWQLIRFATKAAPTKSAGDIAASRYAIAVSMVLDRMDEKRAALRIALKNNRVLVAKELLTDIYDTEYALQVRIDGLDKSEWGKRLRSMMDAIAALVEAEISRFPDEVGHVLGSPSLRSHHSLAGRLTHLAWKGRDAVQDGAGFVKKLIS
ncbi:MAG TPA: hypothetical protein VIY09_08855 [Rhizomicrobium sp.]